MDHLVFAQKGIREPLAPAYYDSASIEIIELIERSHSRWDQHRYLARYPCGCVGDLSGKSFQARVRSRAFLCPDCGRRNSAEARAAAKSARNLVERQSVDLTTLAMAPPFSLPLVNLWQPIVMKHHSRPDTRRAA